jgi:hypothetical protein
MADIVFNVSYYDDYEKNSFASRASIQANIHSLVTSGLKVDDLDLITKGMYLEQSDRTGWKTRLDLQRKAVDRIGIFQDYFRTNHSIHCIVSPQDLMNRGNSEWIGVAAGIAAMDQAFGLHAADWQKIPVSPGKDLDFIASTNNHYVYLECKGSAVDESTTKKTPAVSKHRSSIKDKKHACSVKYNGQPMIGTITVVSKNPNEIAQIWLVDPVVDGFEREPADFKLLSRLKFYYRAIRFFGRPHLLIALVNRINILEKLKSFALLNSVSLVNIEGDEFPGFSEHFISERTHSVDLDIIAHCFVHKDEYFIIGIDVSIIPVLASQNYVEINAWKSSLAGRSRKVFNVSPSDLHITAGTGKKNAGTFDISVEGSGMVFGRYIDGDLP